MALHDPFVALAFVAACTSRLKLGTAVFVLPLRNAVAVAKAVASTRIETDVFPRLERFAETVIARV